MLHDTIIRDAGLTSDDRGAQLAFVALLFCYSPDGDTVSVRFETYSIIAKQKN